jgi:hypothetical protein
MKKKQIEALKKMHTFQYEIQTTFEDCIRSPANSVKLPLQHPFLV